MSGRDRIAVENYVSKYFEKAIGCFNFNPNEKRSMMEILFNYSLAKSPKFLFSSYNSTATESTSKWMFDARKLSMINDGFVK